MSQIPEAWMECILGEVIDYGATTKVEPEDIHSDDWILELEDIEKDTSRIIQRLTFKERESKSTKNQFTRGDVLYGKLRPYLNKVVIADSDGLCTTEIIPLKAGKALDARFVFYWLKHPRFLDYVTAVSHGLNMPRLGTDAGKSAPFVLAPLPEQKRIADKLDAVLGRVDACRTRLARVPDLLKRFRQSVLAAATSGRLTEEWRRHNDSSEYIQTTVGSIAEIITKGSSPKWQGISYVPKGPNSTLFVTSENVREYKMDLSEPKYVESAFDLMQKRSVLQRGDILTNIVGASIGRSAIFHSDERANINQAVCLIRIEGKANQEFILHVLNSPDTLAFMHLEKVDVARANLSLKDIANIPVALPCSGEQVEIVRRINILFAYADRIEDRLKGAQTTVDRLTPSTLVKAFRGELVSQDPNDEPANVLLARIQSERSSSLSTKPRAKRHVGANTRAPKKTAIMTKSRYDEDVKDKPYLATILRGAETPLDADALFKRSELSLVDFYKQLGREVEQGFIRNSREKLEAVT